MKVNIYIHCFTSLTSVISNYLLQVQECTLIVVSVFFFYGYFINGTQRIWTALKTAVIWSSDSQRNLIIYQLSFFFFLNFPLFFCFFIFWSCFSYSSNLFIYLFLIFISSRILDSSSKETKCENTTELKELYFEIW